MVRKGMPMVASSGYVAEIDTELCTVCQDCVEACPFGALATADSGVVRDWGRCLGCGVCERVCTTEAVRLVRDEAKGIPLDVNALGRGVPAR